MSGLGLDVASHGDLAEAHALVARLIGPPLAELSLIEAVHARTEASVFVFREDGVITGALGELPLSPQGLGAIKAGTFRGAAVELSHVARPGDVVSAYYCWGNAAATRKAAAVTVRGMIAARDGVYRDLPYFARAAAPADDAGAPSNGARISFRRFDCGYFPGQPHLLYSHRSRLSRKPAA